MQKKFYFFERNKDEVGQETLNLLKEMFKKRHWNLLIKMIDDRNANPNFFESWKEEHIYEFVLEYAIIEDAQEFILDLINHKGDIVNCKEIIHFFSYEVLYHYAKLDDYFQSDMIAFMVKNNSSVSDSFSIYEQFSREARNFFQRLGREYHSAQEINELERPIKNFLTNENLNVQQLDEYYREWVRQYVNCLRDIGGVVAVIENIFFKFLSNDKNIRAFLAWQMAVYYSGDFSGKRCRPERQFKIFLNEHAFDKEEIEIAIWDCCRSVSLSILSLLVEKLNDDHPVKIYLQKINILMNLNSTQKCSFIVTYQDSIFGNKKLLKLFYLLTNNLSREDEILLISHIVQDPSFRYPTLFKGFILVCDDELICRYLQANHTPTPDYTPTLNNFLNTLVEQNRSSLTKIISLLVLRKDYKYNRAIIKPLYTLFLRSDLNSIAPLLNNSEIFSLLKNYYPLKGDSELRMEQHESFMPLVLAWYLCNAKDKAVELFLSFTEGQRTVLLKGFVPRCIDPNEPSIRSYILQLEIPELVEVIGGLNPRFFQKNEEGKLTPIVHKMWKNPVAQQTLIEVQRKIFMKYAKAQSKQFQFAHSSDEAKLFAQKAAVIYAKKAIYLQHQTKFSNAEKIVSLGYFRTRAQIENTMLGQASGGLTLFRPSVKDPGSSFIHMTRLPVFVEKQEKTNHFANNSLAEQADFILNCSQLLAGNPYINFMVIGPYQFFNEVKKLTLPNGFELISNPKNFPEKHGMRLVEFNDTDKNFLLSIYKTLFEFVFDYFISRLDEPLKLEIIQKLTEPSHDADRQLATDFLNLLHLEWLIPGNVPLKLSYVERVDYGEKKYVLSELRKIIQDEEESKVLAVIREFKGFEQLPFLVNDVLNIALKRKHQTVVREMVTFLRDKPNRDVMYYPTELYEIESLVQLILEDLNDHRVYLHYLENKLLIHSTLRRNSHHGGAHHAEMAKLHFALWVGDMANQDALSTLLADNLAIPLGANEKFESLHSVRDALLTFEVTTLLTCYQNQTYYVQHNGDFHPITGKGATNGKVALLRDRLYQGDTPYQIQVSYNKNTKSLEIKSSLQGTLPQVAQAISDILTIAPEELIIRDNKLTLSMTAWEFIARLRQTAIFYEGINVITEDGKLLLAYRHHRGLASAGGHHGDKYSAKGVGYGLYSEFGLKLKVPALLNKEVVLMNDVRFSSKTGIYIIPYTILSPTKEAKSYAFSQNQSVSFKADPEEFQVGSEVALTLSEMRGKCFYDVMPIAELCQYQLNKLKETLLELFPKEFQDMCITIDDTYEERINVEASFKIPSKTFGRMCFSTSSEFPPKLQAILESFKVKAEGEITAATYLIDESPVVLLNELIAACEEKRAYTFNG